jgi:hypothetical protein
MDACPSMCIQRVYVPCFFPGLVITSGIYGDADRYFVIQTWTKGDAEIYETDNKWKQLPTEVDRIFAGRLRFLKYRLDFVHGKSTPVSVPDEVSSERVGDAIKSMNRYWGHCVALEVFTLGWIGALFWKKIWGFQLIFHVGGIFLVTLLTLGNFKRYRECTELFTVHVIGCYKEAVEAAQSRLQSH